MGEREDNVYKAKLAEQAERYDGESSSAVPGSSPGPRNFSGTGFEPRPRIILRSTIMNLDLCVRESACVRVCLSLSSSLA